MSPSTEYLDMDRNEGVSHKNRGLFVSHRCIAVCVVLVVAALAVVVISTKMLTERADQAAVESPSEHQPPAKPPPKNLRLPRSLVPVHYDVELKPTLEGNFTFAGSVAILVKCATATSSVTLHVKDLNVSDVSVSEAAGSRMEHDKYDEDKSLQFLVISLKRPLAAGSNYTIRMNFVGSLNDDLAGFYRSSYVDASGRKR
ncbi:hypothetical protein V5799_021432 [Amblyomma americanum]|uniref:Aminopeptidase N-like N-terminal domain-containing protein n=1 Tax=Amblyomma americanum TaxID=6943 RepID=A0AAQ4FPT7_AMBAM